MIQYNELGNTGIQVSRIALGTGFRGVYDTSEAQRVIEYAIDSGINLLDCANIYKLRSGVQSEIVLGKAIAGKRDKVFITSKFGSEQQLGVGEKEWGASAKVMFSAVESSLKRLNTDYIDFYFIHNPDGKTPTEETVDAFDKLVKQGKIRYYGLSNYFKNQINEVVEYSKRENLSNLTLLQNPYNLLNRSYEEDKMDIVKKEKLGFMVYSPVATGLLGGAFSRGKPVPEKSTWGHSDVYKTYFKHFFKGKVVDIVNTVQDIADAHKVSSAAVAIAWVLSNKTVSACISGSDTIGELEDALSSFEVVLTEDEKKLLDTKSKGMEEFLSVDIVSEKVKNLN